VPRPYRKFHAQTQEPGSARRYNPAELLIEYCQTNDMDAAGRCRRAGAGSDRAKPSSKPCGRHPSALPQVRLRRAISVKGK
jgi:hypothetical protein